MSAPPGVYYCELVTRFAGLQPVPGRSGLGVSFSENGPGAPGSLVPAMVPAWLPSVDLSSALTSSLGGITRYGSTVSNNGYAGRAVRVALEQSPSRVDGSLLSIIMAATNQVLIEVPMPIRTPRLTIRPKEVGDGAITSAAVAETWQELNRWMRWAENRDAFTAEVMEIRNRQVMSSFLLREAIELIGIETQTGEAVVWCGFHDIDWKARQCDTGYWVRKSAQRQGFATETANAMIRYAFGALGMQRVGLTHSAGNEPSRRIAEKLGFDFEGIHRRANLLPGGKCADRHCYARFDLADLPHLEVSW